jgi:hypothetical protein
MQVSIGMIISSPFGETIAEIFLKSKTGWKILLPHSEQRMSVARDKSRGTLS